MNQFAEIAAIAIVGENELPIYTGADGFHHMICVISPDKEIADLGNERTYARGNADEIKTNVVGAEYAIISCRTTKRHETNIELKPERIYKCTECEKIFAQESTLDAHKRIHSGVRPYACVECDKCFKKSTDLLNHQRIHSGERPFACTVCGRAFAQVSNLRAHQRTHAGMLPFGCSLCDKRFNIATNLQVHERTHSGERPFTCFQCDTSFMQAAHLRRHILRIHSSQHLRTKLPP